MFCLVFIIVFFRTVDKIRSLLAPPDIVKETVFRVKFLKFRFHLRPINLSLHFGITPLSVPYAFVLVVNLLPFG